MWMNLKNNFVKWKKPNKKYLPYDFTFTNFLKMQTYQWGQKADQWFPGNWGGGWRREGGIPKKFWGVMIMFTISVLMIVLWVYIQVKTYQNVHFKYLQFIECQLDLNKIAKKLNSRKTNNVIKNRQRFERTSHCRSYMNEV